MVQGSQTTGEPGRPAGGLSGFVTGIEQNEQLDRLGERLQPLAESLNEGRRGEVLRGEPLGHALHPLLTDLPLGCFMAAHLLDLVGGRRGRRSAQRLIGLGLLAVPPTVAAGMADWSGVRDPGVRRVGIAHAAGNGLAAMLYLQSWRSRRKGRVGRGVLWGFAGGGTALVSGYLGGHLSFGEGVGVGPRGIEEELRRQADPGPSAASGDGLVGLDEASSLLGVPTEQVRAMAEEGVLAPVYGDGPSARFLVSDIEAVRLAGG